LSSQIHLRPARWHLWLRIPWQDRCDGQRRGGYV